MGEGSPGEEPLRSAGMRIEVRQELSISIGIRVSFLEGRHPTDANVGKSVIRGTNEGIFELPVSISQRKATYYIGVRVLPLSLSLSFSFSLSLFLFLSLSLFLLLVLFLFSISLSSWSMSFLVAHSADTGLIRGNPQRPRPKDSFCIGSYSEISILRWTAFPLF